MTEGASLLLILAFVVGILVFAIGGKGAFRVRARNRDREAGRNTYLFNLRRAGTSESIYGYLVVQLLATITTVQLAIEIGLRRDDPWLALTLVLCLIGAQALMVLAQKAAMWFLALMGVVSSGVLMVLDHGLAAAGVVLVISVLLLWVGGLLRGFVGQSR